MVLGVDVGGTKIAVAAVDGVTARHAVEHPTVLASTDALLDGIEHAVRDVIKDAGQPDAIGVRAPSRSTGGTGTVENKHEHPADRRVAARRAGAAPGRPGLRQQRCELRGARRGADGGAGEGPGNAYLGTGVGGGVVTDGTIFRGADGLGAELGHFFAQSRRTALPRGAADPRAGGGVLLQARPISRDATELAADKPDSVLAARARRRRRGVSGLDVIEAARGRGRHRRAARLFDRSARMLGNAIAGYVKWSSRTKLVIGGGLSRASDLYLDRAVPRGRSSRPPGALEAGDHGLARPGWGRRRGDRRRRARRAGGRSRTALLRRT